MSENHDHMSHGMDHTMGPMGGHDHSGHDHGHHPSPVAAADTDGHHGHDDGGMSMDSGHHMMMSMFFHGGSQEVILFNFWRVDSVAGLLGSMVVCLLLGLVYEALKAARDALYRRAVNGMQQEDADSAVESGSGESASGESGSATSERKPISRKMKTWIKTLELNMWSRGHLLQTVLHAVQITLSYFLMLVFMTYNSWLCLATVLGLTLGYFLFGWRRSAVLDQAGDCCH